jgi:hypothetical protein
VKAELRGDGGAGRCRKEPASSSLRAGIRTGALRMGTRLYALAVKPASAHRSEARCTSGTLNRRAHAPARTTAVRPRAARPTADDATTFRADPWHVPGQAQIDIHAAEAVTRRERSAWRRNGWRCASCMPPN